MTKTWERLKDLLRSGITPEKIALSVALGMVLGVFPVLGSTMLLCALAAWILRLNLAAIQAVNYLVYPLQFALLVPFLRIGEAIYGAPRLPLTSAQVVEMVHTGAWHATKLLWRSSLYAITAWAIIAPPVSLAIYMILVPVFRRVRYTRAG